MPNHAIVISIKDKLLKVVADIDNLIDQWS